MDALTVCFSFTDEHTEEQVQLVAGLELELWSTDSNEACVFFFLPLSGAFFISPTTPNVQDTSQSPFVASVSVLVSYFWNSAKSLAFN